MADELKLYATSGSPFVFRMELAFILKGVSYKTVEENMKTRVPVGLIGFCLRVTRITGRGFNSGHRLCVKRTNKSRVKRGCLTAEDEDVVFVSIVVVRRVPVWMTGVRGEHRCVSLLIAVIKVEEKAEAIRGYRCAVIRGDRSAVIREN
ncbi:putative glutathione transferase [Helianthus anomalus]